MGAGVMDMASSSHVRCVTAASWSVSLQVMLTHATGCNINFIESKQKGQYIVRLFIDNAWRQVKVPGPTLSDPVRCKK